MTTNLDRSLDEILATRSRGGRGKVSRSGPATNGAVHKRPQRAAAAKATVAVTQNQTRAAAKPANGPSGNSDGTKIIVSNLPFDVTEQMIKEYFSKVVGPVKSCVLSYGPNGESRGIATIIFTRIGDANKAASSYNGVLVDKKPMKVELVFEPKPIALADRIGPVNKMKTSPKSIAPKSKAGNNIQQKGGARGGRGNNRRAGRTGRPGRKHKTAEELDAEMADYFVGDAVVGAGAEQNGATYNNATASGGDAMDDGIL